MNLCILPYVGVFETAKVVQTPLTYKWTNKSLFLRLVKALEHKCIYGIQLRYNILYLERIFFYKFCISNYVLLFEVLQLFQPNPFATENMLKHYF